METLQSWLIGVALLPGLPAGALTTWVIDKIRPAATGQLEYLIFFTMVYAAAFWIAAFSWLLYWVIK